MMRHGLVVSGVLGLGTALVFSAAALVSAMFPNGTTVAAAWNGGVMWGRDGMAVPMPAMVPMPAPAVIGREGGTIEFPAGE